GGRGRRSVAEARGGVRARRSPGAPAPGAALLLGSHPARLPCGHAQDEGRRRAQGRADHAWQAAAREPAVEAQERLSASPRAQVATLKPPSITSVSPVM